MVGPLSIMVVYRTLADRKITAYMQSTKGPDIVGFTRLLEP